MPGLGIVQLSAAFFRSHERLDLSLDGRPVAIFGANGAGKTNILEAVSLLSPGRGLRRAVPDDMAARPAGLGWRIGASLSGMGLDHDIDLRWEPGQGRSLKIDGKPAPQVALGRLLRVLWLVPAMDRLWLDGAEGRRRFLDRIALSFEPRHAEAALAYDRAMRDRNRLLKDQVRDPHWYAALEATMAQQGAALRTNRADALSLVAAAQDRADSAFPAADLTLEGDDADDLAAALADGRSADMAAGRTLTGPHRADLVARYADKDMPARDCSTGEQKALLISLVMANARALADMTGSPPVLLLDEVAAHLDADRRAALYDEVCALGTQAFMTGTGPELFTALGDRAEWLEVSETGGKSKTEKVSPQ